MSRPRVVVDNSAILPAYIPEEENDLFDAGLLNSRSRSLVAAIRRERVQAFVPPSFFREFLNVATKPLFKPGGRTESKSEEIQAHWEDLLILPLQTARLESIIGRSGELVFDAGCPAADAWYVAAAEHAQATLWMSHEHRDGLFEIASRHVAVRLLSRDTPNYCPVVGRRVAAAAKKRFHNRLSPRSGRPVGALFGPL